MLKHLKMKNIIFLGAYTKQIINDKICNKYCILGPSTDGLNINFLQCFNGKITKIKLHARINT
jgi:pantothenate kinase